MTTQSITTHPASETEHQQRHTSKSAPPLETVLAKHPFLEGISPSYLKIMAGYAYRVRFGQGQFLFYECQPAHLFYLVYEGRVSLGTFAELHGEIVVQTIGKGEVLGWSCLVPPRHWRFDAKAIEPTRAISLDGESLRTHCEKDHDFGYEMLKRLSFITAQRLEMIRLQLGSVHGRHL